MRILKFSIITILSSFITSCNNNPRYYVPNDKGVVICIQKVQNDNEVTIKIIRNSKQGDLRGTDYYITFLTYKQYNINDTVYFTNLK